MRTFHLTVLETRIVTYEVEAEDAAEARELWVGGCAEIIHEDHQGAQIVEAVEAAEEEAPTSDSAVADLFGGGK